MSGLDGVNSHAMSLVGRKHLLDGEMVSVNGEHEEAPTPKKARTEQLNGSTDPTTPKDSPSDTPSKKKRGRPPGSKNKPKPAQNVSAVDEPDPRARAKNLFSTPQKKRSTKHGPHQDADQARSAPASLVVVDADKSARRKSAKTLIERTISGDLSDELDGGEEEDTLAREIWNEDKDSPGRRGEKEGEHHNDGTPTKRKRGRPKGSKRKRTPTPPPDLPPHERYFFQNRLSGSKTSSNTLSSLQPLSHEEYFELIRKSTSSHASEQAHLEDLHAQAFNQWTFELSAGFSICLHGYGSKKRLITRFAEHLSSVSDNPPRIVILNGQSETLSVREIIHTLGRAVLPPNVLERLSGTQPSELLSSFIALLNSTKRSAFPPPHLVILINSIDAPLLRRSYVQTIMSRLASDKAISLLATASHPSFPLMWNSSLRTAYNFVFHDCTTFRPPESSELDVVNTFHELLGRSGRRVGGKEGVAFVLKSLPEKARALYRVLVAEQLSGMIEREDDEGERAGGHVDGDTEDMITEGASAGVEYRVLYQKATEEFICSDEISLRTMLKEFYDHQMISSRRDVLGGTGASETLYAPFSREELEAILEELIE